MSDLLIKNMDLPTKHEQLNITIFSDGSVLEDFRDGSRMWNTFRSDGVEAIKVPSHGRLIDAYKLRIAIEDDIEATAKSGVSVDGAELWKILNRNLESSPTVLEANK